MGQIEQAVKILRNGGVIAYPTDTTYGIGCDITNTSAVQKIFVLKGRDFNKPLSIACSSLAMVEEYAEIDGIPANFFDRVFPGPVTLLLEKKQNVSDLLTAGSKKVGVRIPGHPEILELIESLGKPIITTSANLSGESDPVTAQEVKLAVDLVLEGKCIYNQPSTIIDISSKNIVRSGVNADQYQGALSSLN